MFYLMDGRAFNNVEDACILETADTEVKAIKRVKEMGSKLHDFEIAIVEDDEVRWDLYA